MIPSHDPCLAAIPFYLNIGPAKMYLSYKYECVVSMHYTFNKFKCKLCALHMICKAHHHHHKTASDIRPTLHCFQLSACTNEFNTLTTLTRQSTNLGPTSHVYWGGWSDNESLCSFKAACFESRRSRVRILWPLSFKETKCFFTAHS